MNRPSYQASIFNDFIIFQHKRFVKALERTGITSRQEMAMVLAHIVYESHDFSSKVEEGCPDDPKCSQYISTDTKDVECRETYDPTNKNKYYGRSFILIRYCVNYLNLGNVASGDLGYTLAHSPEMVATPDNQYNNDDNNWAFKLAFAYWNREKSKYEMDMALRNGDFDATTKVLRPEECTPEGKDQAATRFAYYSKIHQSFGMGPANPKGCPA